VSAEALPVLCEKDGPICYITLNRPEKRNALSFPMFDLVISSIKQAENDDDVKVIVLRGKGPAFCAGHDLSQVGLVYGMQPGARRASQRARLIYDKSIIKNYEALLNAMKPIITQVQGACIGLGMMMCYVTDLTICADDAKFGHTEQRLGVGGHLFTQVSQYLTVGPKKGRELLLLNEWFDGPTAVKYGIANKSVPLDQLDATVRDWALKVARHPKDGLVMGRAWHQQTMATMGAMDQLINGYITHSHMTNLRFEEEEYNFFKGRRDGGVSKAIHDREDHYLKPESEK